MANDYPHLSALSHIVAIGGGHGLGRLMSALASHRQSLTGIVTTTDNGGSTGRIRFHHGGIAWGDLRNCLTQLIVKPTVASELFEYRFGGQGELAGHNLGNLILKALEDMQIRPLEAMNLVRNLLHVPAQLIPMSEEPLHLAAELESGETIVGEVSVDALCEVPRELSLTPQAHATPEAIEAVKKAQLIVLGPGSFMTSIMPPLLIPALAQAIAESRANVVFIDNITPENTPAGTLSLQARIAWLERHIGQGRLNGVITQPSEQGALLEGVTVLRQALHADDVSHRHDRKLLRQAVNAILPLL